MDETAGEIPLFEINPALDRASLAARFAAEGRVQIRDVLTARTADTIAGILERETPWGLASAVGKEKPTVHRAEALRTMNDSSRAALGERLTHAVKSGDYAFLYAQYPMLQAYLERWQPDHPLDLLLEHVNDQPLMELVRDVTNMPELVKADAQATLFAPGHFLSMHDDSHVAEGWRVAYVFGFAREWRPDWGGYLMFYDDDDDVIAGLRPRFNTLNLFAVPQRHNVTYVVPSAPVRRLAITGWFRDR
jgi:Rps23 Pro-64 3,4-dihydroxylase Tpa1-like proline 4-hydroxylase